MLTGGSTALRSCCLAAACCIAAVVAGVVALAAHVVASTAAAPWLGGPLLFCQLVAHGQHAASLINLVTFMRRLGNNRLISCSDLTRYMPCTMMGGPSRAIHLQHWHTLVCVGLAPLAQLTHAFCGGDAIMLLEAPGSFQQSHECKFRVGDRSDKNLQRRSNSPV